METGFNSWSIGGRILALMYQRFQRYNKTYLQSIFIAQNSVQLKILEAYTRDVGRGVTRIDYESMDALGASTGDILEITGR